MCEDCFKGVVRQQRRLDLQHVNYGANNSALEIV